MRDSDRVELPSGLVCGPGQRGLGDVAVLRLRDAHPAMLRSLTRTLGRRVSPSHRRWRRLLDGLVIAPEMLPVPLPEPGPRDVIICGSPRSGTTLLAAMLYQPPSSLTVSEPWDAFRLLPAELFASLRAEVSATGAMSRGRLDVTTLETDGRVEWTRESEHSYPVSVTDDYVLGVKFPALWRYLDHLYATRFLVCLRDPLEVVRSYQSHGGRLVQGLDYDIAFNRVMNESLLTATRDPRIRRVLMYDYIASRVLPHLQRPHVMAVRYERWFTEPEMLLAEIGDFLQTDLAHPKVRLAQPRSRRPASEDERVLMRKHCHTLDALGYTV